MNSKGMLIVVGTLAALSVPLAAQGPAAATMVSVPVVSHPNGSFVTVNGAKLWYESEGSGEPLILIAGGPGYAHDAFNPWFSAFASTNRVIYLDALGRGKSDRAKDVHEYTLDRDVEDLEAFRKALGLGKINVLGHSYGGIVAQAYALRFPDSLQHLVLADTTFDSEAMQAFNENLNREIHNQYPEVWKKMEQLRAKGFVTCSKEYQSVPDVPLPLLYFYNGENAKKLVDSPFSMDVVCAVAGPNFDVSFEGDMGKIDFRKELKQITVPTLILAGRYDRVLFPWFSLQYKQYAPQAQFVMFEKSGHFPFVEEPDTFVQVVSTFLRKR